MTYTAVFQDSDGKLITAHFIGSHDRPQAWKDAHEDREDPATCLVLLIDGEASVRTFEHVVDIP